MADEIYEKKLSSVVDEALIVEPTATNGNSKANEKPAPDSDEKTKMNVSKLLVVKTAALLTAFLALGMNAVLFPPTLLHIEILYGTDTKTVALTFVVIGLGFLVGSALCGLVFDRVNNELLWIVSLSLSCLAGTLCPYAPTLLLFNVAIGLQTIAMANIDAGGNSYCVELWTGHRLKDSMVQAVQFFWSMGATLSPLLVKTFLVPLPVHHYNEVISHMTSVTKTDENYSALSTVSSLSTSWMEPNSTVDLLPVDVSDVRLSYVLVSSTFLLPILLFTLLFLSSPKKTFWKKKIPDELPIEDGPDIETKAQLKLVKRKVAIVRLAMMVLLFTFDFFYAWIEVISSGLLVAFSVKGLYWPVNTAALTVTLLFAAQTIGRFLAIPISAFVSSRTLLIISVIVTTVAFSLMALTPFLHEALLWLSVALAGLGMATIFGSCLLWASTIIRFDGAVAAIYMIGSGTGSMTGPPLAGYLLGAGHHMMMAYLCLVACACELILIACMQVCANISKRADCGVQEETATSAAENVEERCQLTEQPIQE